jgi:hypothetical protein
MLIQQYNNDNSVFPMGFGKASIAAAAAYYAANPIADHIQASPSHPSTVISVPGERVRTSNKKVAECLDIFISELECPRRHSGESMLSRCS